MRLDTIVKRLVGFLKVGYEPEANTVVITLRLNACFVQGALVAAVFLTLVFRYGGISFDSGLQLIWDVCQSGFWFWLALGVVLVLMVRAIMHKHEGGPDRDASRGIWLARVAPRGVRGTALVCLGLLVILIILMGGASCDSPKALYPEVHGHGDKSPRLMDEIEKRSHP